MQHSTRSKSELLPKDSPWVSSESIQSRVRVKPRDWGLVGWVKMARIGGQESAVNGGDGLLVQMCIEAACKNKKAVEVWRRQRRTLEKMASHLAGRLFHCLLRRHLLSPSLLEVFQQNVEEVNLIGESSVDTEWLAYLGAYRHLRILQLAGCKAVNNAALWNLTGMTTLEELDLSRCLKITDAGVGHLLSLPSLKKLSLSETGIRVNALAQLCILTSLTFLDLGGLPVTDSTLFSLRTLTQLQHLDVWGSQISNKGAASLKAFPKLDFLNLAWTTVTQVPVLPSLTTLNMSKCTIDSFLDRLEIHKTSLLRLHFSGTIFTDVCRAFSCLDTHNLSLLDLSGSNVDGLPFLAGISGLQHLDLSCTGVTDLSMNSVADVGANLKQLNLSGTKISSNAIAILVGNVPKLEYISLSHTAVDDNVLACLSLMPALRSINLSYTNIKGFIHMGESRLDPTLSLAALQQLENLEILELENTQISDLACQPLSFLKELNHLCLRSDFLSDISLHKVSSLPKLKYLSIQGAVLTNPGLCSFIPPPTLQILDLRDCWLLTKEGFSKFSEAYPQLELRHESIVVPSEDQTQYSRGQIFSDETKAFSRVKQERKLGSKPSSSTLQGSLTQRRFVDERVKYSIPELLHIQATSHSAFSLSDIGASIPTTLKIN